MNPDESWTTGGGGSAGGIIFIAGQTINFSGTIRSNGLDGSSYGHDNQYRNAGAGSGGSIRIEGANVALNTVTANGGSAWGYGGQGRIAVYYYTSFHAGVS
ncbi:hypothetical protein MASR2M66_26120 [Chloroflexota bacterium]